MNSVMSLADFFNESGTGPALPHAEARRRLVAWRSRPVLRKTHGDGPVGSTAGNSIKTGTYSPGDSRALWYAVLLFLYPAEEGLSVSVSEALTSLSRAVVLDLLRGEGVGADAAGPYLAAFGAWARGERTALVREVAGAVFNLGEIRKTLEDESHPSSLAEWAPFHTRLRDHMLGSMQRAGMGGEVVDEAARVRAARDGAVAQTLRAAYWDGLEADLEAGRFAGLLAQLDETRAQLARIVRQTAELATVDGLLAEMREGIRESAESVPADVRERREAIPFADLAGAVLALLRRHDCPAMDPVYDAIRTRWEGEAGGGGQPDARQALETLVPLVEGLAGRVAGRT